MTESRAVARLKRPIRRTMDGVAARVVGQLAPRLDRMGERLGALEASAGQAPPPLFSTFHDLLHALRTVELSQMPRGARVLLSAGCSGRWYFDWVEHSYGPVDRHIGIERYEPRPEELPSGVEWIATSVADLSPVADSSVDLVFSGQNVEHLFGDDLVDFLCECARVVHPGGHLVLDSPHREIARLLVWSMNQHTIEFTPDEATELVELAGFRVTSLRGIWLARDPFRGNVYPLDPVDSRSSPIDVARRIQLASRYPHDSFIWWLEGVREDRSPDRERLRRRHAEIFAAAWPERANRLTSPIGVIQEEGGQRVAHAPRETWGPLVAGPYMPLAAAAYELTVSLRMGLRAPVRPTAAVAAVEVVAEGGDDPLIARREVTSAELVPGRWVAITIPFSVPELRWTGEFRVHSTGAADLDARLGVILEDRTSPVWPSLLRAPMANG